ncbi:MAG: hypothetical protein HY660_10560 [Armatimonadetes bacterium]|nr:hypothetical protein [Armatimonadota bacterium]
MRVTAHGARAAGAGAPWDRYLLYLLALGIALFAVLPPSRAAIDSTPPTGSVYALLLVNLAFLMWTASDLVTPSSARKLVETAAHAVVGLGLGVPLMLVTRATQPVPVLTLLAAYAWLLVLFVLATALAFLASRLPHASHRWVVFAGILVTMALLARVDALHPWMSPLEVLGDILQGRLRGLAAWVGAAYLGTAVALMAGVLRVEERGQASGKP